MWRKAGWLLLALLLASSAADASRIIIVRRASAAAGTGACCEANNGGCTDSVTSATCTGGSGTYQGDSTTCAVDTCGCDDAPDFSNVEVFVNWDNDTCTTLQETTYTTAASQATNGEYPTSKSWVWADGGQSVGLLDTPAAEPASSCAVRVDNNDTSSTAWGGFDADVNLSVLNTTEHATLMATIHQNQPTDTASSSLAEVVAVGTESGGDNRIIFRWDTAAGYDIEVFVEDGDGNNQGPVTTHNDTTSGCCGGTVDVSGCDDLFASGGYADNTWVTIEARVETGTVSADYIELYVDGCKAKSETAQSYTDWDWSTSDDFRVGAGNGTENGDWTIGTVVLSSVIEDLTDMVSGGDDSMGDGNECTCADDTCGS